MNAKKLSYNFVFVFLVAFGFIFICYVGLPIDFSADYVLDSVRSLSTATPIDLVKRTLNPLTPGWFYPPNGMMEYMRPLQVLPFHVFHHFFPQSLIPFSVSAAVGHGLLCVLIAGIIHRWTGQLLYGWLAVIIYASFPSNFFMMASIGPFDFQYFVSILTLSTLLTFFWLTTTKTRRWGLFVLGVLGWIVLAWVTIKLKSSEKVIPFVCLAFLILRSPHVVRDVGFARFGVLIAAFLFSLVLVVPFKTSNNWGAPNNALEQEQVESTPITQKDNKALSFQWKNGVQRTFFIPGGEFPFTTPFRDKFPRSFSENVGFFLAWLFWLGLLLLPLIMARSKREYHKHFLWLMLVWFAAIIAGFSSGAALSDLRFLNFAYIPFILVLFTGLHFYEEAAPDRFRSQMRFVIVIAVAVTAVTNFSFLGKHVAHFGGIQDVLVRAERDVFASFYQRPAVGDELYEKHQELETRAVVVDWYDLPDNWFESAELKLAQEGQVYLYARNENPNRLKEFSSRGYKITLWKRYDFLDAKPFIFRVFKGIQFVKAKITGKTKRREVVIYKIEQPSE